MPLRESTRRFLRPLLGFDPASARVYRGPLADQVATSYGADAVAMGDAVALSAGNSEDTLATLGLLAHELTHVARSRDPRFVPPVVARAARPSPAPGIPADEERLAGAVERMSQDLSAARAEDHTGAPTNMARAHLTGLTPPLPAERGVWGGLPAPWEPLPAWLEPAVPAQPRMPGAAQGPGAAAPIAPGAPSPASSSQPPATAAPTAWRAETSRPSAPAPSAAAEPAPPPPEAAPAPDLDALARQVYAVLKRRLAEELRRRGS